ncbi:hypothetical protein D9M68_101200 [compost metagenome]
MLRLLVRRISQFSSEDVPGPTSSSPYNLNIHIVRCRRVELLLEESQVIADARRILTLAPKDRLSDQWGVAILSQRGVKRFLAKSIVLPETSRAIAYVTMAARCIADVDNHIEFAAPITTKKAEQIQAAARKLTHEVRNVAAVQDVIAQPGFRSGLEQLSTLHPPQDVPVRNRKGNPQRRAFIWAVGQAFYANFQSFHTEAITEVVALLWPCIDDRVVSRELTDERKDQIARAAEAELAAAGAATLSTASLIQRAQRAAPMVTSEISRTSTADLSDSDRIRRALELLEGVGDKELARSLTHGVHTVLGDFDYALNAVDD